MLRSREAGKQITVAYITVGKAIGAVRNGLEPTGAIVALSGGHWGQCPSQAVATSAPQGVVATGEFQTVVEGGIEGFNVEL